MSSKALPLSTEGGKRGALVLVSVEVVVAPGTAAGAVVSVGLAEVVAPKRLVVALGASEPGAVVVVAPGLAVGGTPPKRDAISGRG